MAKITTLKSTFISYILALISSIYLCECDPLLANASINGFTTDLIHRDAPDSPLFDPSSTPSHRLAAAVERSRLRAKHLNDSLHTSKAAESIITAANDGSYLMRFSIGTPSVHVIAILDTASHLTWTQCRPCNKCLTQRLPIFDPQSSHTYNGIRCDSYGCDAFAPSTFCDRRREKCLYNLHYGDSSTSNGVIAEDIFSFTSVMGRVLFFNKILFGCGHNNYFKVNGGGASGIVGLAGGSSSLVRQLGYDKFAYCLMVAGDHTKSSKLHFGGDAVVSGRGVVATPLSTRAAYYFLTLEAISVGNKRLEYHNPFLVDGGNIIIDSGSLLTFLPVNFYDKLEVAIANSIAERAVRDFRDWRLCYSSRFVMPKITLHFEGADVGWKFNNAFVRVSEDYVCLAVDPMEGLPIYGSVAQSNYLVGYDLGKRTVSFKQTQCGA